MLFRNPNIKKRSGKAFANFSNLEPTGIAGVIATIRSSFSAKRINSLLITELHDAARLAGLIKLPVSTL